MAVSSRAARWVVWLSVPILLFGGALCLLLLVRFLRVLVLARVLRCWVVRLCRCLVWFLLRRCWVVCWRRVAFGRSWGLVLRLARLVCVVSVRFLAGRLVVFRLALLVLLAGGFRLLARWVLRVRRWFSFVRGRLAGRLRWLVGLSFGACRFSWCSGRVGVAGRCRRCVFRRCSSLLSRRCGVGRGVADV